jgi:L-asparaginase
MEIVFITTGGTIDKVYFDQQSDFEVGESQGPAILKESGVTVPCTFIPLFEKDSLDITDEDRQKIRDTIESSEQSRFIVTHGTDTMVKTAEFLNDLDGKIVVLTGSLSPARFKSSDAAFNVGSAMGAVQCLPPGAYIAMNGRVSSPYQVRKNRDANRFDPVG